MADVNLEYQSSGFERTHGELKTLEETSHRASTWFKPMQSTLESVGSTGQNAFRQVASGAKEATGSLWDFITGLTKVTAIVTTINGLLAGAGVYAFGRWSESMLKATESSRTLEATMRSVLGNEAAFQKISQFAKGAAAASPTATYQQVMETAKTFSLLPGTQPIYEQGNTKWMKTIEDTVEGLSRMFPKEGREGADYMVKQALAKHWRPFEMQTGRTPESLAQGVNMGKEEMESSSLNILKAINSYAQVAPQIATLDGLLNKLRGSYHQWLEDIGNTGIYDKTLGYLQRFNQFFEKIASGTQGRGMATAISSLMGSVGDSIEKILSKGVDWERVTDTKSAIAAFKRVGSNTADAIKEGWDSSKDTITSALSDMIVFAAESSLKVGWSAGKNIGLEIWAGMQEGMKQKPGKTMLEAAGAGAYAGKSGLPGMAIGAAVGAETVAAPSQWQTLKGWWQEYDAFMGQVQSRIVDIIGLAPKAEAAGKMGFDKTAFRDRWGDRAKTS